MSAKDELDDFERDWQSYKREQARSHNGAEFYFNTNGSIRNVPACLSTEFWAQAERLVELSLDNLYALKRARLVDAAVQEAEATLARLKADPPPPLAPVAIEEWPVEDASR